MEIEPGRYVVAPSTALVTRVTDIKATRTNDKGPGHTFVMVDAGFVDLVRPAMYGSYHHITVYGADPDRAARCRWWSPGRCASRATSSPAEPTTCSSRGCCRCRASATCSFCTMPGPMASQMSSNYISLGRAPQVWLEDGRAYLITRRETVEDVTRRECFEPL